MRRTAPSLAIVLVILQIAGCPQPADDSGRPELDTPSIVRITASVAGDGRVQTSAPGPDVVPGTSVTFLALPSPGWRFARWEGASTSTEPLLTLTINDNITLAAIFEVEPPPPPSDLDGDGVPDATDNCPATANRDQRDSNGDGLGDACTPEFTIDFDGDGIDDTVDNCPVFANPDQADADADGLGDACELTFDFDGDGVEDSVDNCMLTPNPTQADSDGNGIGDACELTFDSDGDGVEDSVDNCMLTPNPTQADSDGNGIGDACELTFDSDGDGVEDSVDNCILTPNPTQADSDGNGIGDACEIVTPPLPPGGTGTIADVYGGDVIELTDGTVWEVTFGFTLGWFAGDRVLIEGSRMINLDEVEEVNVNRLGQAILHDRIHSISSGGEFVLLSSGTLWQINPLDRFRVTIWLPIQQVVVVQSSVFSYRLVRETDGQIVRAAPATP